MTRQGRPFSDPLDNTSTTHPTLQLFWTNVAHKQDLARRRYRRARRMVPGRGFGVWGEEPSPPEPSDDEAIPAEPVGNSLALPAHFHLLLGSQDPRLTQQDNLNSMHAHTSMHARLQARRHFQPPGHARTPRGLS